MRFTLALSLLLLTACNNNNRQTAAGPDDSLDAATLHNPEHALKSLQVAEGLELTLVAAEPMLKNPTNIDVDHRGRVWVTEAYNYRPEINGNPTTPRGDRIVILEDTNGDGTADTSKVFYQGPDLASPLGVAVLGNRVLVSQSPYVWAFWDDDGDDKADRKEVLFQGIGGVQHDHGVHSFLFGPDGKLYFTMGNEGKTLLDRNGRPVRDRSGRVVGPPHFRQGMALRCNPDGTDVEVLGHNFRNNYEAAPDAFGALWQSDNDDDGNRATRLNFILPGGNYGYTDERTGAGWNAPRTGAEDSVPLRHWHLSDPGVVPNLLQTGSGSPAGLTVYEGDGLPAPLQNTLIHCDPGVNAVRSYPVVANGAGYATIATPVINGTGKPWFRPVDVCVAPDGSLLIADWYDPGVGGHAAGDQQRGRIYRLGRKGTPPSVPAYDYTRADGAAAALLNPNGATRYRAWTALEALGPAAITPLDSIWTRSANPRMRARAFWALLHLTGNTDWITKAASDTLPELRMMALRAMDLRRTTIIPLLSKSANDTHPGVRREAALALRGVSTPAAAPIWADLASGFNGADRWMLEALGIAAERRWDAFLSAYLAQVPKPLDSESGKEIVWRARSVRALPFLAQLAGDSTRPLKDRHRFFRAFDFHDGSAKEPYLLALLGNGEDTARSALVLRHLSPAAVEGSARGRAALAALVEARRGTPEYLLLTDRYRLRGEAPHLLRMVLQGSGAASEAARLLLQLDGPARPMGVIRGDTAGARKMLEALATVGTDASLDLLQTVALDARLDTAIRYSAANKMGWSWGGEERVLTLLRSGKMPEAMVPHLVRGVSGAWRGNIRTEAQTYLPASLRATARQKPEPALARLNALGGAAPQGKVVFARVCGTCHVAGGMGAAFGPELSETGSKLPREALYEAIVRPSAGISFGYEGQAVHLRDGSVVTGILSSRTQEALLLRFPGGSTRRIPQAEVVSVKPLDESLMPSGLHNSISEEEFAHLLRFLEGQKKGAR